MNRSDPTPDASTPDAAKTPDAATPDELGRAPGREAGRRYPFRPVLGLAVLAVLGLLATAGVKSYRDLAAARDHEQRLQREIAGANRRIQALYGHIDSIQHDPAVLERLAREDLGLVRDGDVVIVLPEPPPEPEPPRAADPP